MVADVKAGCEVRNDSCLFALGARAEAPSFSSWTDLQHFSEFHIENDSRRVSVSGGILQIGCWETENEFRRFCTDNLKPRLQIGPGEGLGAEKE